MAASTKTATAPVTTSSKPNLVNSGPSIFTAAQAAKTQTGPAVKATSGQAGVAPTIKETSAAKPTVKTVTKPVQVRGAP